LRSPAQDGRHSAVALLLKAALIQVSDYRLLGASGSYVLLKMNAVFLQIDNFLQILFFSFFRI
jgi:hypothetical protein